MSAPATPSDGGSKKATAFAKALRDIADALTGDLNLSHAKVRILQLLADGELNG